MLLELDSFSAFQPRVIARTRPDIALNQHHNDEHHTTQQPPTAFVHEELEEEHSSNPVLPTTREVGREASRGRSMGEHVSRGDMYSGAYSASPVRVEHVLTGIEENEQEPAHSRASLASVISLYNSLSCDNGPIGALFKSASMGLAFANVPNSSIINTSHPLTAMWTRWQMSLFCLVTNSLIVTHFLLINTLPL